MKQGKHWVQKRYFTEKDYRRFAKETIRRQKEIWNMSKKDFILGFIRANVGMLLYMAYKMIFLLG